MHRCLRVGAGRRSLTPAQVATRHVGVRGESVGIGSRDQKGRSSPGANMAMPPSRPPWKIEPPRSVRLIEGIISPSVST